MSDEFGRSFEEQLQDQIIHSYWIDRGIHGRGEYVSDTSHLDGGELPHGFTVTYDHGPQYEVVDVPLAVWHRSQAIELLDDSYEALLEYFDNRKVEPVPDGGHQLETPQPDTIWFWYDATADCIIQEEVEPYNVVGLFESEDDADRFIEEYARKYGLEDASHFEKYQADLSYEGQGPILEEEGNEEVESGEGSEQAGVDDGSSPSPFSIPNTVSLIERWL